MRITLANSRGLFTHGIASAIAIYTMIRRILALFPTPRAAHVMGHALGQRGGRPRLMARLKPGTTGMARLKPGTTLITGELFRLSIA